MFRLYLLLHEAIQIKFTFSFVLEVMLQGVVFFSIKAVVGSVKSNNNHYDRIIKLYYVRLVRKKQTNIPLKIVPNIKQLLHSRLC